MLRPALGEAAMLWILAMCILVTSQVTADRWSRQLTNEDNKGWVPLETNSVNKRQATPRVLAEPAPFQSSFFPAETNPEDYRPQEAPRQLFVQSVPAGQAFANPQTQPVRLTLTTQYNPLAQAFVPRTGGMPLNEFMQSVRAQFNQPALFVPPSQFNNQFYSSGNTQKPNYLNPQQPSLSQNLKSTKPEAPRFVDGYKLENVSVDYLGGGGSKSLFSEKPKSEFSTTPQILTERSSLKYPISTTPKGTTVEKEEVQLLYVPLETLQNDRFDVKKFLKNSQKQETIRDSVGSPVQINNQLFAPTTPAYFRQQTQLNNINNELRQQALNTQFLQGSFQQNQFFRQPKYSQPPSSTPLPFSQVTYSAPVITTPKSKKLKANQPPLAVYMIHNSKDKAKLSDVLNILKESSSISVLDSIAPNSPKIFIGPNNLNTPENIIKFDLPYLTSIDGNRIQRKIETLPFFVAPLSYKAPQGFAKIPFPAPHVGSVIVNPNMRDSEVGATTAFVEVPPSTYQTFPQTSTTESFRSTIAREPVPTKQNAYSSFSSVTPGPFSQTTLSGFQSSYTPFVPLPEQYRPLQTIQKLEPSVINANRQPTTQFYPTSPKPTVSFFGFTSDFNTLPTTTHKPSTPLSYENRGHYITNAAIETSRPPYKINNNVKEIVSERPKTSPLPINQFVTNNPYANTPFILKNPYEPTDFRTSFRGNDIRNYNIDHQLQNNFNKLPQQEKYPQFNQQQEKFPQFPQQQNKYSQFPVQQNAVTQSIRFPPAVEYTPQSYITEPAPSVVPETKPPPVVEIPQDEYNQYRIKDSFIPSKFNQYTQVEEEEEEVPDVTQDLQYVTEEAATTEVTTARPTTTTSTTTTTTTTTPAPITKTVITRRPIHSRGRPRYTTTPRSDNAETTIRTTTRRTPTRERRPISYRSRTTTTTESSADSTPEFETSKKKEYGKSSTRYSNRFKTQDEEEKPTTESTSVRPTINRNTNFRSRGKSHFRPSDTEKNELVPKKKEKGHNDTIAYQRDVLHQNYPVTLSERASTVEIRTTTSSPTYDQAKIRIYETTGSTQRSYSTQDTQASEPSQVYENEPVFQAEQEKYLTQPDIEINGRSGSGASTIDQYSSVQESTTQRFQPTVIPKQEESTRSQIISENYFQNQKLADKFNLEDHSPISFDISKEIVQVTTESIKYAPDVILTEEPIPKFRSKLKHHPKLLQLSNAPKSEDEYQNVYTDTFVTSKKPEENTENTFTFTRRNSVSPVTYRPAFSNRRTTMKIEEIEEELKSRRQQVKHDSRSTTFKYPVYIPEASSTTKPSLEKEGAEVVSTTKKTHFIRRRPIRPTTVKPSETNAQSDVTTVQPIKKNVVKRVRVHSRLRTRPTTQKAEYSSSTGRESSFSASTEKANEENYSTTQRTVQKYSRTRPGTQKYFKRPAYLAERNQANENIDDQASFDSINRPEYLKFNPVGSKSEQSNDPENGKSESHWSPKLSQNTFHPIFNPNFIENEAKPEGFQYGSKATVDDSEIPDIITARSPYDDVLIAVTPSSNNANSKINGDSEENPQEMTKNYDFDTPSTFESVLEEVMRKLEEQDENEYEKDYVSMLKHEGGEIGEIPPESTSELTDPKEVVELNLDTEIKKVNSPEQTVTTVIPQTTFAENRVFNTATEQQVSSTERQGRRRGGWRRVRVRPVMRDFLEPAESQFYKNSKNELFAEIQKSKVSKVDKAKPTKLQQEVFETTSVKEIVTATPKIENTEAPTTMPSTNLPPVQEYENDNDNDEVVNTEIPDLIAMEMSKEEVTVPPADNYKEKEIEEVKEQTTELERQTEYLMSQTDSPVLHEEQVADDEEKPTEPEDSQIKTTIETIIEKQLIKNTTSEADKEFEEKFTTESTQEVATERNIEIKADSTTEVVSFSEAMDEIIAEIENTDELKSNKDKGTKHHAVTKKDHPESTTSSFNFFDPQSIVSTSVSTEISHETEICYRGKCVKTKKQKFSAMNKK